MFLFLTNKYRETIKNNQVTMKFCDLTFKNRGLTNEHRVLKGPLPSKHHRHRMIHLVCTREGL
jgi:sulfur relay (sulfurtransferase) complex TusBCD TusD component (DsrE family)